MNNLANNTPNAEAKTFSQFPEGYLANGYLNQNGEPDYRYVADIAKEIAKKLVPMKQQTFYKMYERIEYTGLLGLDIQIREIKRLVPMAANLVRHGKAPEILLDFCKANASTVKTVEDCTYYRYHMEAICGYME